MGSKGTLTSFLYLFKRLGWEQGKKDKKENWKKDKKKKTNILISLLALSIWELTMWTCTKNIVVSGDLYPNMMIWEFVSK